MTLNFPLGNLEASPRNSAGEASGPMTTLAEHPGRTAAAAPAATAAAAAPGGTGGRLLRFALANLWRRPERFVLSTLGIALAIMAVVVVRTIAVGFAGSGSASVAEALGGAPLWVVPAQGVRFDPQLAAMVPGGFAPRPAVPPGWRAQQTTVALWASPQGRMALYGEAGVAGGTAVLGGEAARVLRVPAGGQLSVAGARLTVALAGSGRTVAVPAAVAARLAPVGSWWTVRPPASLAGRLDLGRLLSAATGIPATTEVAQRPGPAGLIYDTTGGGGTLTFAQRLSAFFAGQVTGSVLGLVSTVGLGLGFVIAVTSFLASVQERRREFGIMASIGLADEVLYFFLVESGLVFLAAYLAGALLAGAAVLAVVPSMGSLGGWLQAAGITAAYLPAMAIIGALVPVHRLLQQRPVALLAETT